MSWVQQFVRKIVFTNRHTINCATENKQTKKPRRLRHSNVNRQSPQN